MQRKRTSGRILGVLGAALALSVGLNVALAVRASQQRDTVEAARISSRPFVGTRISGFDLTAPNGERTRLEFSEQSKPTVVYSFRPGCLWCSRNHESVRALYEQSNSSYRFVGLALETDGLEEFLTQHPLPFDVYTNLDDATVEAYQLAGTPRTVVIERDGTVTANWFGAYYGSVADEIESKLDVSLPRVDGEEHH